MLATKDVSTQPLAVSLDLRFRERFGADLRSRRDGEAGESDLPETGGWTRMGHFDGT